MSSRLRRSAAFSVAMRSACSGGKPWPTRRASVSRSPPRATSSSGKTSSVQATRLAGRKGRALMAATTPGSTASWLPRSSTVSPARSFSRKSPGPMISWSEVTPDAA